MKFTFWMIMALLALLCFAACDRDPASGDTKADTAATSAAEVADSNSAEPAAETPVAEDVPAATEGDSAEGDLGAAAGVGESTDTMDAEETVADEAGSTEETTLVVLETTVGDITVEVHSLWAPLGAEHFLMLVKEGYYDGAPFFRVVPDFMAQCGFSGDHELTAKYLGASIADDPVIMGNFKYTLSFGNRGGPSTRSTHIFINFKDNNMLDTQPAPFPAFAKVVDGFDAVDKIFRTGEVPGQVQQKMAEPGGAEWFIKQYPDATVIKKAYIKE